MAMAQSSVRIVLLGKDVSGNSRVGNFMLGRSAFESESPSDDHHCCERVRGKNMTLINCPHLLQPNLTSHHITQTLRECVYLSHPGPHVIILILKHHDFSEDDRNRVKFVVEEFSDQAMKRTIVLTTEEEKHSYMSTSERMNEYIIDLIKECGGGHIQFDEEPASPSEMFRRIDEILKREPDEYLKCEISETCVDPELMTSEEEEKPAKRHKKGRDEECVDRSASSLNIPPDLSVSVKSKLNVVLCGADATLKVTVSKLLRGKLKKPLNQREFSSVCVKEEEKVDGRQICVVDLPALSRLSEEEMMCQTLNCVSLCDPGVHSFLIIVPVGPLTDEHREEIKKIQKNFNSTEHFMMIFMTDVTVDSNVTDFVESYTECQRLISLCGGQYRVIGLRKHKKLKPISIELLDYIENMTTEPYSLQMYVRAQEEKVRHETEEKYEEKLSEMMSKIRNLQLKISSYGVENEQEDLQLLRIVLIGRTGNGKSATGNTILGRNEFESKLSPDSVTTVCEKRVGEVGGQSVAVVDTPGLFDTTMSIEQVMEELVKCVSLLAPGPHVFIIVLNVVSRFTREELETIDLMKKIFGRKAAQFSIVLFTRGDDLQGESIEDFVKRSNCAELNKLIRDCGNRFLVFNNRETQDRSQVTRLINMIKDMKTTNQSQYFTNSMFEEAEMSIKKKMEKILKEKEREIQTQIEELIAKHEIEMENMTKRLETEKRKADEEKMKMIRKFNEQEETLRKEFEEKEKTERLKQEKEKQKQLEEEKQQRDEYDQKIEEMKREIEQQRSLYEQQWREREEEERKREENYRQDLEKMKQEQEKMITELEKIQEEEIKKRETEELNMREQEEREREEWTKIKEAEKDIKEEIKQQQREWEEDNKRQMKEREEDERKRKKRHEEQLREKQEELEKMRQKFEKEREEDRRQRDEERQKQRQEKEEREREYEEKKNEMMKHYEKLESERKETWGRRKQEDDERREEERKKWEKRIDDIKREQEEEIKRRERERKEREEKEREEMKEEHEWRIKEMKKKHEDEARKQAENEFKERNEQHVQELKQMLEGRQKQQELLEKLYQHFKQQKGEEIEKLQKDKLNCVIM